jgi:valyl-tRNA synthetase
MYRGNENIFAQLASASDVVIASPDTEIENALSVVTNTAKFFVPLDDLIDKGKELQRLQKEQEKAQSEIARLSGKLSQSELCGKSSGKNRKRRERKAGAVRGTACGNKREHCKTIEFKTSSITV